MQEILDLDTFPIDKPDTPEYHALVMRCKNDLAKNGMYNLDTIMRPEKASEDAKKYLPIIPDQSFTHKRSHNIYFKKDIPELPGDHPALIKSDTINHTLCADQLADSYAMRIYQYDALRNFIADTMDKPVLHLMDDTLAQANMMDYYDGEALNWHFDRSEFTVTLLLQAPAKGGEFEYRTNLRTDDDPNYDGVARLLQGKDSNLRRMSVKPGTLNVFRGKNTAHRVTPIEGNTPRVIAVFSYYEHTGVHFTEEEHLGFYGRTVAAR